MLDPLIRFPEFRNALDVKLVPITLIGGFLGAGKTTLLNSLLRQSSHRRFAVLVNDFGELNIDAKLIVNVQGQDTVELSNGCICCTVSDDLVAGVMDLIARPDPPEHILIETSGVSDPLNILFTFVSSRLRDYAWIDNVVTVVDAVHAGNERQQEYWKLFERQISAAYTVVLNKVALAGPAKVAWARDLIEELIPGAQIIETASGEIALPLLLDDDATTAQVFRPSPVQDTTEHPLTSVAWRSTRPVSRKAFEALLIRFRGAAFRAKGLIHFCQSPKAVLFQMVGNLQSFVDGPEWGPLVPTTELVFIGSPTTLDRDALLAALGNCEAAAVSAA
jgi:G3E family GTPase